MPSATANDPSQPTRFRMPTILPFALGLVLLTGAPAAALAADEPAIDAGGQTIGHLSEAEADAIITDIDRAVAVAAEEIVAFHSDRLDLGMVAAETAGDPGQMLEWVTANTTWVPYLGALRGAAGTLMDRTGNSLDRALLLSDLLRSAGYETQLARTQLADDVATDMLMQQQSQAVPEAIIEPLVATPAEIAANQAAAGASAAALADIIGLAPTDPAVDPTTTALTAIADHWWVQADIDGATVDLDPLFGTSDEARPTADSTFDPDALPDDLRHALTVRVVAETWADDGITSFVPLEYTHLFGAGLPHRSAELRFDYWADAEPDAEITSLEALSDAVSHWQPVLTIDGQQVRGEWFSNAGQLEEPTSLAIGEAGNAATSALGGLGDAEPEAPPATELSALWIEYESSGPGLSAHVERRELADALGADRRMSGEPGAPELSAIETRERGAALLGTTDILMQEAALHPDALYRSLLQSYVDNRNAYIALVYIAAGREDERIIPAMLQTTPEPLSLMSMAMARTQWHPSPGAIFFDRPNVWTKHLAYDWTDDQLVSRDAIDIVMNHIAVSPSVAGDPRELRLAQGVADTMIESVLATEPGADNTWLSFDRSIGEAASSWTLISSLAELKSRADSIPANDLQRMADSLTSGHIIVADLEPSTSEAASSVDWWRISPSDGTTLGLGDKGWGQTIPENRSVDIVASNTVRGAARNQLGTKWVGQAKDTGHLAGRMQAAAARARGIKVTEINEGVIVRIYNL